MDSAAVRAGFLKALLTRHLAERLGDIGPDALTLLLDHLEWVELPGGATLLKQGDPGDSMYLIVSGRLRAYITDDAGHQRMVREISRGQIVGEMSLYTDEPRSATLVAIRDTVLARLPKRDFRQLLSISGQVSIALTRQIIEHLKHDQARAATDRPVTIGLIPISDAVAMGRLAAALAAQLRNIGRVAVIDAAALDAELDEPGIAQRDQDDAEANRRIAFRLDAIEAEHDFVLLLSDPAPTQWTRRCSRQCDELYLLAEATQAPLVHPTEAQCLLQRPMRSDAIEILVLLHAADQATPTATAAWLGRRPIGDHLHIRPDLQRDMARLARLISRTAIGLVLAGGGARGLAHLGVYRALQERGIDVDVVGGTSIGSVMATYVASDQPAVSVIANARRAFSVNPTGDMNLIPMLSLMKGLRLRRIVRQALLELTGSDGARIEDLWKTYYCVATNYSQACEQVVSKGPLLE
ncbi:MAG: cyclic nucleotide-binding and patatin-like phospholipase domain-containing protein, partial [Ideonella sp.]